LARNQRAIFPTLPDEETYYVYAFYDRGDIFYIGKGRWYRCTKHFSEYSLKESTPKNSKIKKVNKQGRKVEVRFFAIHLTEREALVLEKKLIESYGLKSEGGVLTNLRYGSLDSAGLWTEDRKKLHSERLRGKNSNVPLDLVKKAKCLSYYRGMKLKDIVQLDEFAEYNLSPGTIRNWCQGKKFSYILPHLNHDRSTIRNEKYNEFLNLFEKGFALKQISDILGLEIPLVHHYNSCRKNEGSS